MSTTTTHPDYTILGQEVPLGRVDKALKELWAADDARDKASLMNFAIYSEDPTTITTTTQLLAQITKEHACRGLLILNQPRTHTNPQQSPSSRAWITAHCTLQDGRKSVCSEQISFIIDGGNANLVRNTVFAHLDSDLPLVFWWQGDLTSNFDERLYNVIDVLLIDSSRWTNPTHDFTLLSNAAQDAPRFRVHDLSWLRSHYFRTALATCFHDPAALAEINQLQQITITHGPGHRVAALLLIAWLTVRLKAQLQTNHQHTTIHPPKGQPITIHIHQSQDPEPLQTIHLTSPQASFSVTRNTHSNFVNTQVTLPNHLHREDLLPADLPTDTQLIASLLSRLGRRSLYLQMLPTLQKLLH